MKFKEYDAKTFEETGKEFIANKDVIDDINYHLNNDDWVSMADVARKLGLRQDGDSLIGWSDDQGWYTDENGDRVFGSYISYLNLDPTKVELAKRSKAYINHMRELSQKWPV